jgi:hypothetical protein
MKIFIGWSGERSKKIAQLLYEWLPTVVQNIKPYMSTEIDKGTRWGSSVAAELQSCNFGIFCLTQENLAASWIHFEAGALSKVVGQSHVVPILFDLAQSHVQGPLIQFQSMIFDREDVMRLLKTINKAAREAGEEALEEIRLERAFSGLWNQLDKEIKEISEGTHELERDVAVSANPVLEEILVLARQQTQMLAAAEVARPILSEQILEIGQAISRLSSLPHPDHFVWRDLAESWTKFLKAWVKFTAAAKPDMMAGQEEELKTLLHTIFQLQRPIEFLVKLRRGPNPIKDNYLTPRARKMGEIIAGGRGTFVSFGDYVTEAEEYAVMQGETPIVARATADKPSSAEGGPASPGGPASERRFE